MKMKKCFLLVCCMVVMSCVTSCAFSQADIKSVREDQSSLEVTVYNSNIGLVKDTRKINLARGVGNLLFMDVASSIIPESVHVKSLSSAESFSILEQNYEYDLMNSNKLLDKYVGKTIKLVDPNKYVDRVDVIEAVLLSNNNGQIYKINEEIFLGHAGYQVLPEIPENLIAKPTLSWLYESKDNTLAEIETSYLANNITWKTDYIVVLNEDDSRADISGWVTLDNRCGVTFANAQLTLVAGEINRAAVTFGGVQDTYMVKSLQESRQFEEESFFEYHIYNLGRKTTIKDKQTKQIKLIEALNFEIKKEYLVNGQRDTFFRQYDATQKQPVNVFIKYKNSEKNKLGMPLPAGIVRLYKKDKKQSQQLIGEDNVDHTPKDEEITLKVGEAFDLVAERKQTDYKKITSRIYETEWEITLRNHKEEDVVICVNEYLSGDWEIIQKSHSFVKENVNTVKFDVEVPKDEEVKLVYRVRIEN